MLAIMIINIIVLVLVAVLFGYIAYSAFRDDSKDKEIAQLEHELEVEKIRNGLHEEALAEYKRMYPIKSKYRVGTKVYVVEDKTPVAGIVIAIQQDVDLQMTYSIQYGSNKTLKTVVRDEDKVYKTLANAIESENLV